MKAIRFLLLSLLSAAASFAASAQYYEIANQVSNIIRPALSGSLSYRGFAELSGTAGIGTYRANIIGISTSQGFQYASWFFMGAGIGVDIAMRNPEEIYTDTRPVPDFMRHSSARTMAMIPVFSDFRFKIGGGNGAPACFIDVKAGATWLIGNDYLEFTDARMGGGAQFYLRPSIGVRVPLSAAGARQAVSIGVAYQLITSDNWYTCYDNSVSLSGFGAAVAFEW